MSAPTFNRVTGVLMNVVGTQVTEPLTRDTPLVGGGLSLDSATVLELLLGLEKEFGLEISADELLETQAFRTLGALAQFIDSKLPAEG
jgi:acyl carrier protein